MERLDSYRALDLYIGHMHGSGGQGVDAACATVQWHAVSAPFLLDPAASILNYAIATGRVPGGVTNVCIRLVAGILVGLAVRVCGGAAVPLAEEALGRL